ncbi:pyridoxal phosphate-dependent aminotransferase [Roseivirga seohaensis subsp. aquiponti]|uniref:GDP-perosamine synthase n=1 Tax=Roseivirga seohaensis subsp. aquiponti TaxID=1566026 RepID=A0A0L8AM47_9BACT|nr:aminotransferase class I/II-fold pyridoxal phosphate-dependent enzyme [Roseivirga seohaensis]KOF03287.1 pyridoxal phosphate-dependent aminotransferase [Roseivirga seohaensis subsp. aquiponti]
MESRIWLSSPHMGGNELKYVKEAFDTNWIAPLGPNVDHFEKELGEYLGVRHVAALSSGTAAIHLALILLGVKAGDEVIAQSFTFCGTTNPILYLGATPVLVDSEHDTWNLDPVLLEEAILDRIKKGKKPKAVIMVHLYGMPAKMEQIVEVCNRHEIPLIEDAAEALGSTIDGRKAGTFGDMGILSFNGNKIITTSGGGALVSNNTQWIEKSRFLATQARDEAPHYEHTELGYNYRMSNILAGVGRGQLEVLDSHVSKRRAVNAFYREYLSFEGISFQSEMSAKDFSNYWLTSVKIEPELLGVDREDVRLELWKSNIETRPLWKPMHLQPLYKDCVYYGNGVSDELFTTGLCLPSGSNLTTAELERVVVAIKGFIAKS